VTSEAVSTPVGVRYGWANVPEGNLFKTDPNELVATRSAPASEIDRIARPDLDRRTA
jgi:hypothetical protein